MNWNIDMLEYTPNGPLSCLDVAWGRISPMPMFFVLDATLANPESAGLIFPRARLLNILGSCWSGLRDLRPRAALQHLGDYLHSLNESDSLHSLHASAAMGWLRSDGIEWELAECGDTKIYRWQQDFSEPVWTEGMPAEDHRVAGLLGSSAPSIRYTRMRMDPNAGFTVLTDGAYHVLASHGLMASGKICKNAWTQFDFIKTGATDDATMIRITPTT